MTTSFPLRLLLAAGPADPAAAALLEASIERARAGQPVSVLLSDAGLSWAWDERLATAAGVAGLRVSVCSASARDAGWTLTDAPPFVAWSALVAWLRDLGPEQPLWAAFP